MPLRASFTSRQLSLLIFALFAFTLPFELNTPWLTLGPLVLTNVEIMLALCLLMAGWLSWRHPLADKRPFPRWFLFLIGWFILSLLLSSWLTAKFPVAAFKASLRTLSGILLALSVPYLIRSQHQFILISLALLAGGLLAAALGLIEFFQGTAWSALNGLRITPTMAGPFLRLTGPFDYANHTSMYIEATLPLLLISTAIAYENSRRPLTLLLASATLIYLESSFLTFSRSSFATILLTSVCLTLILWQNSQPALKQQARLWGSFAALTLILILFNLLLNATFRLRLSSEGDNEWYQARIQAPATLQVEADETIPITVTISNDGRLTWANTGDNLVTLAATWIQSETNLEWQYNMRWPLTQPMFPGETLTMEVPVQTPPRSGNYLLNWNLIQEGVVWFEGKSGTAATSQVQVGQTALDKPTASMPLVATTSTPSPIPGRLILWQVAWQLFRQQPLWGIGLDNFRLLYGRELGYTNWNDSVHTNSWYIETAVSLGIIGAIPFFIWLALIVIDIWRSLRQPHNRPWQTAVAAGIVAYLIHGLLDYFLLFNSTGLLFWLLIGCWFSLKQQKEIEPVPMIPSPPPGKT